MSTTSYVMLGVLVVLILLYVMRRKSRLSREDVE
jgi:hypothetical protein